MNQNEVFIVTGGSRGIGAAIARAAARTHHVVIIFKSSSAQARAVANEIHADGGVASLIQADVGIEREVIAAFTEIDRIGRPAVLVNNAAITGGVSRLCSVNASMLEEVFRTNITGAFLTSREAVLRMSTSQGGAGGSIINISSGASQLGSPNNWIHYAASKGAIDTLTIGLSKEVAREGIRVNAVRPGLIDTEIHHSRTPEQLQAMTAAIPLGRMGSAQEVAQAVLWLASPAASYVTGTLLDARGGF
jgi:NAD(P)-dependent dehydrogenase (short-subunit alcohol dehydrogenase family)